MSQSYWLVIVLLSTLLVACSTPTPLPLRPQGEQPNILVVTSNSTIPRYNIAEIAFLSTMEGKTITAVNLENDTHPTETLLDVTNQQRFDAIYAIGAKALGSIDYIAPPSPVVYSSVLSWRRFKGADNYYGVASEISPQAQLTWFKHFFPRIQTIAILYSASNEAIIQDAVQASKQLGILLTPILINQHKEAPNKLAAYATKADALWIMPDPIVINSEKAIWKLFDVAHKNHLPVFAYNHFYMALGATMTINADLATNGRQAGLMIQKLTDGQALPAGIQSPAGSSISLSMKRVKESGLQLNFEALNAVDELFSE